MKQYIHQVAQTTGTVVRQLPRSHKVLISSITAAVLLLALLPSEQATASKNVETVDELILGKRYQLDLEVAADGSQVSLADSLKWSAYEVRSGDNLAKIFDRMDLTGRDLYEVTEAGDEAKALRRLHPGDTIRIAKDNEGRLIQLAYDFNATETLLITRTENGYVSDIEAKETEVRTAFAYAQVENSFWNAGINAGLTDGQIMSVADI